MEFKVSGDGSVEQGTEGMRPLGQQILKKYTGYQDLVEVLLLLLLQPYLLLYQDYPLLDLNYGKRKNKNT